MSVAISGMTINAPKATTWVMIESGTVYHFFVPTVMDGFTTSPNISRGTEHPPYNNHFVPDVNEGRDYSQTQKTVSTNQSLIP